MGKESDGEMKKKLRERVSERAGGKKISSRRWTTK